VSNVGIGNPRKGQKQQYFSPLLDTGSGTVRLVAFPTVRPLNPAQLWLPAVAQCPGSFDITRVNGGAKNIENYDFNITYNSGVGHTGAPLSARVHASATSIDANAGYYADLPVTFASSPQKPMLTSIEIAGATNKDTSCSTQGMMGVGVDTGYSNIDYPSTLKGFVSNHMTATRAFSLFLDPNSRVNGPQTSQGRVMCAPATPLLTYTADLARSFGGVDSSLFVGPLKQVRSAPPMCAHTPIGDAQVPIWNSMRYYHILQNTVSISRGAASTVLFTAPKRSSFLLDSGAPGMILYPELGKAIARQFGAVPIPHKDGDWAYGCDCALRIDLLGVHC
jgi:hypothetical protein